MSARECNTIRSLENQEVVELTERTTCSLPEGKRYHVIFSYETTDRSWVIKYLEKLEGEYGFSCCFDDRDFLASKEVLGNIEDLMRESLTVLFIISPEHVNSLYCNYEANIAFQLKKENQLRIIPILRRGDDNTVPRTFRFINYIDGRDGVNEEKVLQKIIRAINYSGGDLDSSSPLSTSIQLPPDLNGTRVRINCENGRGVVGRWAKICRKVSESHLKECKTMGCNIPKYVLEDTTMLLKNSRLFRSYGLICPWSGFWLQSLVIAVSTCALILFIIFLTAKFLGYDTLDYKLSVITCCLAIILPVGLSISVPSVLKTKIKKRFVLEASKMTGQISKRLLSLYKAVVILNFSQGISLDIIKYDTEDCQDFVASLLRRDSLSSDSSPAEIEQVAERVILGAIPQYLDVLISTRKHRAANTRHRVRNDVICLCQFIEKNNLHIENPSETTLTPSTREDEHQTLLSV